MIFRVSTTTNFLCKGLFSETFVSCSVLTVQHSTSSKIQKGACRYSFRRNLCHFEGSSDGNDDTVRSLMRTSCLQHFFENRQELRKNRLTASTFAGAVGFWPKRRVQLWLEKIGAKEPFYGNLATAWGKIKEEEALERYKLITGNTVFFPEFQVHGQGSSEHDWLGCSPDGMVDPMIYGLPSHGILEIKCPYYNADKTLMYPWSRIPLYCIPQAQGLMEIMDKDWMDFYCWTINGSSLFRIHRDPDYWELMEVALSDFWWNHIIPAKELHRKFSINNPLTEMRPFMPAPRHELLPTIVVASKYQVDASELKMREIHGSLQVARSWDIPQLKRDQMITEKYEGLRGGCFD